MLRKRSTVASGFGPLPAAMAGLLVAGLVGALPATSSADTDRPAGTTTAQRGYYPYPNGQAPVDTSAVAEIEINHPNPQGVVATLGAVGDPFTPIAVQFSAGSDIIRSHRASGPGPDTDDQGNNGRHNGWNNPHNPHNQNGQYNGQYGSYGSAEISLSNYTQWLDGSREWYLRLNDPNGQAGQLASFDIRTAAGVFAVRNVPASFGANRQIEARVTPRGVNGTAYPNNQSYPNGYPYPNNQPYPNGYPHPNNQPYPNGYPYPNSQPYPNGYPYPNNQPYPNGTPYPNTGTVTVVRSLPQAAMPGQRVTVTYQMQSPYGGANPIDVTETLPPRAWQVVRFSTQPINVDNAQHQVTWRFGGAQNGMTFTMDLIVPQISGWQVFRGTVGANGLSAQTITGMDRIWIGSNYPGGTYPNGYPNGSPYPNNNPYPVPNQGTDLGSILRDIFGLPTG